jgi:hypothetical protein
LTSAWEQRDREHFFAAREQVEAARARALQDKGLDIEKVLPLHDALLAAYQDRSDKVGIVASRRALNAATSASERTILKEVEKVRQGRLTVLAREHEAEARQLARQIFDYPVFMAEVEAAGITSTGLTGDGVPNELPSVLAGFRAWLENPASWDASAETGA